MNVENSCKARIFEPCCYLFIFSCTTMNIRTAFLLAAASCVLLLQSPSFLAAQDVVISKIFQQ
ncbi:MAG: hypothetical protein EAZ92_12770 [Candidatus Kapaibacterium sp.]|nr:MAG: hypothetical protein EAZ92_12770 [Candidatus Kapabacteria bacterium]